MGSKYTIFLADKNGVSTGETQVIDTRNLTDALAEVLHRLNNQYNALYAAGFNYGTQNFQIDQVSQQNINAGVSMAQVSLSGAMTWPANFIWIASDNTIMPLTAAQMIAFGASVGQYVTALILTNRAMKDAIATLTTIADCDAFDVTQGWPVNNA